MRRVISLVVLWSFLLSMSMPAFGEEHSTKPYVAVMNIKADPGLPENIGPALSDRMREILMSTRKWVLIDRGNIEIIMREIATQQTGFCDESCAVEVGRQLSAHFIITGRVAKLAENSCQVSAQMTDVAKAEIVRAASDRCECSGDALADAAENVALDIAGMPRTPGKLVIQSIPSNAFIYIDGEKSGQTPSNIEVKPGRHKVMVTTKGYKLEEQAINIAPGVSMSLNFTLKKEKKRWYQTWWFYTGVGVLVAGGVTGALLSQHGGGGGNKSTTLPGTSSTPTTGNIPVSW